MKTLQLFRFIPLFALLLCTVTACSDDDNERLSSIGETTLEGDATTLQIDMSRSDWRIASVTDLDGYSPIGGSTQLEELGTVYYGWATIKREKENALTIEVEDNFYGTERGFIINLEMKSGFYKEQIIIHQKQSANFYQVESIFYTIEEGDGMEEADPQPWGMNVQDHTSGEGETVKTTFWPFYSASIMYSFQSETESPLKWVNPEEGIYVEMPKYISNGKIVYEGEQRKYSSWQTYDSDLKEETIQVDLVKHKQNIYSADIYYKQLQLSYTLTLSHPNNNTRKTFKGKLIKIFPYGCSPIRHEVNELPESDE